LRKSHFAREIDFGTGDNIMVRQNLAQLTQQIADEYARSHSYVIPTEKVALTQSGRLSTGKNEFSLSRDASEQFARMLGIPFRFYQSLEPDLRSLLFSRRFRINAADAGIGREIRLYLDGDNQIIGYDSPRLLRINPVALMAAVNSSLPKGLCAEEVGVSKLDISAKRLHLRIFSPDKKVEPRPGDIINGGIDVIHYTTGELSTQVHCYLRRMICSNGAITHVCSDNRHVRARRLHDGHFDEKDMLGQIDRLLSEAWRQVTSKLDAVHGLLERERVSSDFLRQQRTRLSLNNRIIQAVDNAIGRDEFGPTNTQYDWFNAISRVATHDEQLSFRQFRTLSRLAGEFSQHNVHRCSQCGNWVIREN
jgi:hypothetical protein